MKEYVQTILKILDTILKALDKEQIQPMLL